MQSQFMVDFGRMSMICLCAIFLLLLLYFLSSFRVMCVRVCECVCSVCVVSDYIIIFVIVHLYTQKFFIDRQRTYNLFVFKWPFSRQVDLSYYYFFLFISLLQIIYWCCVLLPLLVLLLLLHHLFIHRLQLMFALLLFGIVILSDSVSAKQMHVANNNNKLIKTLKCVLCYFLVSQAIQ